MPPSTLTLVAHTHWDREWYEPFEVFRAHLLDTLDDALDQLEADPRLSFTLDGQVALVDDYLELRPGGESRMRALIKAGRLHVGPFYTQADTLLADGESLIRNLAAGIRRGDELGGATRVGYMPDQFGHAAQIPQILRLFGIESAVLWRGVGPDRPPHAFRWIAPDGSAVTTLWLQDGYGSGRRLPSDPEGFAAAVERHLMRLGDWIGEIPLLIPVGDDHTRLAGWLPDAAALLQTRLPGVRVEVGGYQGHLPRLGSVTHSIHGELRSPAFAPVLAGVASARVREKQAAARATNLLLRYAEPLSAWAHLGGREEHRSKELLARAWRQLLLNHAHDSAAGCGVDAAHEDVRARYRWAEQLGRAVCDRALAQIRVEPPAGAATHVVAFHPGPATAATLIEAHLPRSLTGPLVAVGADGVARPVQQLGAVDEAPVFEGEFSAAELGQYLGGLDPATPLFGKYLTGITVHDAGGGLFRLDVGLGEAPVRPGVLAADQRRVQELVADAVRFKVVLHSTAATRPVLVQAGPAPEAGFLSVVVRPGQPPATVPIAAALATGIGVSAGDLSVSVEPDGSVLIRHARLPLGAVRANELVDDGDRGDLYHFDPAGEPVRPRAARAEVVERGPVRARLRIEQDLLLPVGLDEQHRGRTASTHSTRVVTEVTVVAGERRVEFSSTLDNATCDHRLRSVVHAPVRSDHMDVEHGLAVIRRPISPVPHAQSAERLAPTGHQHGFVDVSDTHAGVALLNRGLPEYEVSRETDGTSMALTLLRAVGWLSRGDLSVIDYAAGPMVPTPGAQELGPHHFEYAVVLHAGDWRVGDVLGEARRYGAPALPVKASSSAAKPVAASTALVDVQPAEVVRIASYPSARGRGLVVRLLNSADHAVEARLRGAHETREAIAIDPLEVPRTDGPQPILRDGTVALPLGPWQIATVLLR